MKTFMPKKQDIERHWYLIDANGKILGRLASFIATRLRGKHKPIYTPHADTGDFIIVINAEKVRLTGNKLKDKVYYRHTGYIGSVKSITAEKLLQKKPENLIRFAVEGMLPKNRLGRKLIKKLKVYAGSDYHHEAQKPEILEI